MVKIPQFSPKGSPDVSVPGGRGSSNLEFDFLFGNLNLPPKWGWVNFQIWNLYFRSEHLETSLLLELELLLEETTLYTGRLPSRYC